MTPEHRAMGMRPWVDKGIISQMPPALDDVVDGKEVLGIEGMRMLGFWSARAIFLMEFLYVAVFIAGFASIRDTSKPLPDPYLAIAEILILVMAPILVCLMLAINQCAPKQARPFTQVALGWLQSATARHTIVSRTV